MPNNCDFLEHMNNEYDDLARQRYKKGPFVLSCPLFLLNSISGLFCLFVCFSFLKIHLLPMEVPSLGVQLELQLLAYNTTATATWEHGIKNMSANYTRSHSNARSFTYCGSPGIEPASS